MLASMLQQIRQIPIFLGRRKRSSADDDNDVEPAAANQLHQQLSLEPDRDIRDEGMISAHGTNDDTSLRRPDGSRMEEIRFVLNGKEEKFIVAKEVEAVVDRFLDDEDYDFGP
jgi:hypothetical protein